MNDNATPPTKPIPRGQDLIEGRYYRITEIDPTDPSPTMKVGDVVLCADWRAGCIDPEWQEDTGCRFADAQGDDGYGTLVNGVELVEAPS